MIRRPRPTVHQTYRRPATAARRIPVRLKPAVGLSSCRLIHPHSVLTRSGTWVAAHGTSATASVIAGHTTCTRRSGTQPPQFADLSTARCMRVLEHGRIQTSITAMGPVPYTGTRTDAAAPAPEGPCRSWARQPDVQMRECSEAGGRSLSWAVRVGDPRVAPARAAARVKWMDLLPMIISR
jgi:hypothetical protein